ncbi:MAG: Hsp20/alpha crystallin family protein [Clostridia bacterium]|nr:Hsp20/alpha crystallin family protein [Clostridia bacterium]
MKFDRDLTTKEDSFGLWNPFFDDWAPFSNMRQMDKMMKTDIKEQKDSFALEIEMPGIDKKDIKMDLNNGYLTISAQKSTKNDQKDDNGKYIRRERSYGSFSRSFYVGDIEESQVKAKLLDGVLNVTIPKETKKIEKHTIAIE